MEASIFPFMFYNILTAVSASGTEVLTINTEAETLSPTVAAVDMENYDNSLLRSCPLTEFEPIEYELFRNGTVYITVHNKTINDSHYIIINGTLHTCKPDSDEDDHHGYVDISTLNTEAETLSPTNTTADGKFVIKPSLLKCPLFIFTSEDYELFENGSISIKPYNLILDDSYYMLINDNVIFCKPFLDEIQKHIYVDNTSDLTLIGLGISMISLFTHLIVFAIVPYLKNLPGCNLAALCASLLCNNLLIFVIYTGNVKNEYLCIAIAFLTHFFLLSSILWMSIMSSDFFLSLRRATRRLIITSRNFSFKRFGLYCLCSFGVALLIAIASLLADTLDGVPNKFKPEYKEMCWFGKKVPLMIFFDGPVIALLFLNTAFFCFCAYTLHFNKMKQDHDEQKARIKRRYLMYFRLAAVMGVTWIAGVISFAAKADWLRYCFAFLSNLQGFFIFIGFTCSKKVRKYFREKYLNWRKESEQALAPTFQSYCYYANSIEKDMNNLVENDKDKIDTTIIHM